MYNSIVVKSIFRDYRVHFNGDFNSSLKELAGKHAFLIADALVWKMYENEIQEVFPAERVLIIEASENNKSLDKCQEIIETLVERKIRRNDMLVAAGGGIIQDLTAFSASIIYRGIEWSFFPTTLLAQADSCIGSKTSINLAGKKNLVGNFYPPSNVFINAKFLVSLDVDDIKSGIGEILHYYLYSGSPLFYELISDYELVLKNRHLLEKYIRESLTIKKAVIENDEFDRGERNKFNYGHTFGHAIESVTDYAIKHGQAVTVGMDLANYISMKKGFMSIQIFNDLHTKLLVNFPEFEWQTISLDRYVAMLAKDKKNVKDDIVCILCKGPGALIKESIPITDYLFSILRCYFMCLATNEILTLS